MTTDAQAERLADDIKQTAGQIFDDCEKCNNKTEVVDAMLPALRAFAERVREQHIEHQVIDVQDAVEPWREEVDSLRAKLAPSPCSVEGHRAVDWVEGCKDCDNACCPNPAHGIEFEKRSHCLACERERQAVLAGMVQMREVDAEICRRAALRLSVVCPCGERETLELSAAIRALPLPAPSQQELERLLAEAEAEAYERCHSAFDEELLREPGQFNPSVPLRQIKQWAEEARKRGR